MYAFLFISPYVTPAVLLSLEDEFCLVQLRLGLLMEDLATRFAVTMHNSRFKKLPKMVKCDVLPSEVFYNVALTRSNQREYATSFQTAVS